MVDSLKGVLALTVCLPVPVTSVKLDLHFLVVSYNRDFDPLLGHYFGLPSPEMFWLLDVADAAEIVVPACFEVAHEHPCELVFGLSVERDDLCAYLEVRNGIVVAAGYLSAQRIDPQETALGVLNYLVLFRLGRLLVGQACALVTH